MTKSIEPRFFFVLLTCVGCASTPRFSPHTPIAESRSLSQALLLCNEYRLPESSERPIALKPFLQCLDQAAERHPQSLTSDRSTTFKIFREEFWAQYALLQEDDWTPRLGNEIEAAVHTVLRSLAQEAALQVTPTEKQLVLHHFPRTARSLDVFAWKVSPSAAYDPRLESLKADVSALSEGDNRSLPQSPADPATNAELCRDYGQLKSEVQYMDQLWRDLNDLARISPHSPESTKAKDKYVSRLDAARKELETLAPQISDARKKSGFRTSACAKNWVTLRDRH